MTLREAIGQYIAWRRAQGARFQSQAYALRRYCRTGSRSEGVGATSARTLVSIGRATTITRCASARDGAQRRAGAVPSRPSARRRATKPAPLRSSRRPRSAGSDVPGRSRRRWRLGARGHGFQPGRGAASSSRPSTAARRTSASATTPTPSPSSGRSSARSAGCTACTPGGALHPPGTPTSSMSLQPVRRTIQGSADGTGGPERGSRRTSATSPSPHRE